MSPGSLLERRSTSLAALAVGGGVALLSAVQPWVRLEASDGLTTSSITVSGSALAPLAVAASVVGVAGLLAVLTARTWGRRIVGVLVVLVGSAALVQVLSVVRALEQAGRRWWSVEVGALADQASVTTTAWPVLTVVGLVVLVAAGVLVLAVGARWRGLHGRYEAPRGARDPSADAWQALDRGEDPTQHDPGTRDT